MENASGRVFETSTREMLDVLKLRDPKTLHRRRDRYHDKSVNPKNKIFEYGVHYMRKTPFTTELVWNRRVTVRAWRKQHGKKRHSRSGEAE